MEMCQTSNCDNSPIAICLHCKEFLCIEHLLQHNERLISEANIYCDEFNQLTEQIENMSFDEQFISAEEDLNEWLNDQMKQLDKVYEQKLFELKQAHSEVKEEVKNFKKIQQNKIIDIRRLFNAKLNKQINCEQLNQMKTTVEQLHNDIQQFQTNQCSITLVNNNQINYSYKPNIDIQIKQEHLFECDKSKHSQLNVNAKPFEYNQNLISSIRQKEFNGRLFDGCALFGSIK